MLMADLVLAGAQGNHTSLDADGLEHGAAELVGAAGKLAPVDAGVDAHLAGVDLEDLGAGLLVGEGELDLAVEAAGAQQRRVQNVDAVRGCQHLDAVVRREPVQLVQELQHRALHLAVAALLAVEPLRAHGVQLVDEDDRGGLLLGEREAVPHKLRSIADEHLHELGPGELEERRVGLGGAGSC